MPRVLILLGILCFASPAFAQSLADSDNDVVENSAPKYQLFPTQNMWNFIKLNTANGRMWQMQYDVQGDDRFDSFLNYKALAEDEEEFNGRFTLYPTENM